MHIIKLNKRRKDISWLCNQFRGTWNDLVSTEQRPVSDWPVGSAPQAGESIGCIRKLTEQTSKHLHQIPILSSPDNEL